MNFRQIVDARHLCMFFVQDSSVCVTHICYRPHFYTQHKLKQEN